MQTEFDWVNSLAILHLCFAIAVLNNFETFVGCVVYLGDGAAMSLVERWCCEHGNKFVKREALIDSVGV